MQIAEGGSFPYTKLYLIKGRGRGQNVVYGCPLNKKYLGLKMSILMHKSISHVYDTLH